MLCAAAIACEETSPVGESVADDAVRIIVDSSFTISCKTIETGAVQSRTISALLGDVEIEGYGSLRSDVVAQFMTASVLDTTYVNEDLIDSIKLVLAVPRGSFVGDSLVPMGLSVYPLTRDLPSPIYSDFDPSGYYDKNTRLGVKTYNASQLGLSDTLGTWATKYIDVTLPSSMAKDFYRAYKANPSHFATPDAFIGNVFKGLYITNSYGAGRITRVAQTLMRMYYRRAWHNTETDRDTVASYVASYFGVTPEVVVNNNIHLTIDQAVRDRVSQGQAVVLAPAGLEVELTFPGREIVNSYREAVGKDLSVINSLTFTIPVEEIDNEYDVAPPTYMLLVLKSERDKFFASNSLTDNKTSFYATYNATTHSYSFTAMRDYLLSLLDKDEITDDDVTFVLCPIDVQKETTGSSSYYYYYGTTSTTETAITPYVSTPVMARILTDKAKIKLTYSAQSIKI